MVEVETWECAECGKALGVALRPCWGCGGKVQNIVTIPGRSPADPDYYTQGRRVAVTWPEHDPSPVVTTVDPRPEGAPTDPSAVLKLVRAAQAAGWATRTGYSRGPLRTRSPGRYKDVEIIGVWASEKDGLRWYAMHERTIGAATGWKWGAITTWTATERTSNLKITALMERLFRA